MGLKRKRNGKILKEWIECGFLYSKSQVKNSLPIKHVVIALDPDSKEDYPMYADKVSSLDELKSSLMQRGQKIVEIINI